MYRQFIVYGIMIYDVLLVAYIIKELYTIPGNKKLLNQYKKRLEKKKNKKAIYIVNTILFLCGLIYLCV